MIQDIGTLKNYLLLSLQTILLLGGFADELWSAGGDGSIAVQVSDRWEVETQFVVNSS